MFFKMIFKIQFFKFYYLFYFFGSKILEEKMSKNLRVKITRLKPSLEQLTTVSFYVFIYLHNNFVYVICFR